MLVPSDSMKIQLAEASAAYASALPGSVADAYLTERRGITSEAKTFFRLGYVANPLTGHDRYRNRLAIPYITRSGITSIRFRHVPNGDEPDPERKYLSLPGEVPRIYNPGALLRAEHYVCICEGEMDAITATFAGLPAVGIPGVFAWASEFARALRWYRHVFVLADTDDKGAGLDFGERIAKEVRNVSIVPMPGRHDVNSFVMENGASALRKLIGV